MHILTAQRWSRRYLLGAAAALGLAALLHDLFTAQIMIGCGDVL